jgi:hypothetical protein
MVNNNLYIEMSEANATILHSTFAILHSKRGIL